jgi:hypothetical protein
MSAEINEVVRPGMNISVVKEMMKAYGDGSPMLEIVSSDPRNKLMMWSVGGGVMIASYGLQEGVIDAMWFQISDGKPKSVRSSYSKPVIDFNPSSGIMQLSLISK